MLTLKKIFKSYQHIPVLNGVSLVCQPGVALCLAGANAAGKTTLLTIAAALQKADSGFVECDGTVGFVPQESALIEDLSIMENLMLWYAACGRARREIFASDTVEYRLGLAPFAKKQVKKLSGGYRKRTDIACALVKNPAYILMDEPFNALDLESRVDIAALFRDLCSQGKGILFSSHDPDAIARAADEVVILKGGAIVCREILTPMAGSEEQILRLLMQTVSSNRSIREGE